MARGISKKVCCKEGGVVMGRKIIRKGAAVALLTLCMAMLSGCNRSEEAEDPANSILAAEAQVDEETDGTEAGPEGVIGTEQGNEGEGQENMLPDVGQGSEADGQPNISLGTAGHSASGKQEEAEKPSVGSLKLEGWDTSKDRMPRDTASGGAGEGGGLEGDGTDVEGGAEYPNYFYELSNGDRVYQEIEDAARECSLSRNLVEKGFAFVDAGIHGSEATSSEEDYKRIKEEGKVYASITIGFSDDYLEKAQSVYSLCKSFERRGLDYAIEIRYGDGQKATVEYHEGAEGYPDTKPTLEGLRMLFSVG